MSNNKILVIQNILVSRPSILIMLDLPKAYKVLQKINIKKKPQYISIDYKIKKENFNF